MAFHKSLPVAVTVLALAAMLLPSPGAAIDGETYGVYQYVVQRAEGSIEEISDAIATAAVDNGWMVAGVTDSKDPNHCDYTSRVIVLYDARYADAVIRANTMTGPYAALDRVNIFQDEDGTHVSVVNPISITRTILMDDSSYMDLSRKHLQDLRSLILSSVKGTESTAQYGQYRTKGYIGKTMGVVAGGKFKDLIRNKFKVDKGTVAETGEAIAAGFGEKTKKWGLKLVYKVNVPAHDVFIVGISGSPMDTKSFQIVGAGRDEARKKFACPGLSHAGAYPLEIVVYKDANGTIQVATIDVMYRMKMFFEDAGKWAFMKNMGMPGSIQDEIEAQVRAAFVAK